MEGNLGGMLGALIGMLCGGTLLLAFMCGGVYMICTAVSGKRKVQASQQWPSTSGKILDSRIVQVSSTDSDGRATTSYHLAIRYEYEVGGRQYVNDKRTSGPVPKRVNPRRS